MWAPKKIIQFVVVFTVVYGGLMVLRTPLSPASEYLFRAGGDLAFTRYVFWQDGSVRFVALNQSQVNLRRDVALRVFGTLPYDKTILAPKGAFDTLMLLKNRAQMGDFGMLRTSARMVFYTPVAVIIALFLATPINWRRRLVGLGIGLVLVHFYIYVRLAIDLATGGWGFGSAKPYALFKLSEFWTGILTRVSEVIAENPTVYLGVSVFIWLLVSLLSGGFSAFRQEAAAEAGEPSD
jgi:hypothetical protein